MNIIAPMSTTGWMVVAAATAIIILVLFAKAIKASLKFAVIVVMLVFITYFLHQAGLIQIPGI